MADLHLLRELPGVSEIEAALHVPGRHLLKQYDDLPERINAVSRALFGITEGDTEFVVSTDDIVPMILTGDVEVLTREAMDRHDAWEAHFAFLADDWEEEDAFWALAGLEVRDEQDERLAVMEYFGRQIVCIIKGLHPRARLSLTGAAPLISPSGEDATQEAERWGRRLAEEARRFKRH